MEIAIVLILHNCWNVDSTFTDIACSCLLFVELVSNSFEAAESLDWLLVNVLVLELWLQENT